MKRLAPITLLLLTLLPATATATEYGYASAYAPGVMEGVVRYRFDVDYWPNTPPRDWYLADGFIAAMDCSRVGQMATLYGPDGTAYNVLIADCAGADGPIDRFERIGVIAELDWQMWERLTAEHGRPLRIGLR